MQISWPDLPASVWLTVWIFTWIQTPCGSATIQFSDAEKAFSLKNAGGESAYHFLLSKRLNNKRRSSSHSSLGDSYPDPVKEKYKKENDRLNDQDSNYRHRYYHSSFMLLKDGHIGNKIILKEAGFTVEESLEFNPVITNRTSGNRSWSAFNIQINILNRKVAQNRPSVRIFVHYKMPYSPENSRSKFASSHRHHLRPCVTIYALFKGQTMFSQCRPSAENLDSCFVDLLLPSSWWPRRPFFFSEAHTKNNFAAGVQNLNNMDFKMKQFTPIKRPKSLVKIFFSQSPVSFASAEDDTGACSNEAFISQPKLVENVAKFEKSLTNAGDVQMVDDNQFDHVLLPFDKYLNILVPNRDSRPGDIFAATIFFHYAPSLNVDDLVPSLFQVKCEASNGLRILGTEEVADSEWSTSTEMNYKQSALTVTAFHRGLLNYNESLSGEIISILLQIAQSVDIEANYNRKLKAANVTETNGDKDTKPFLLSTILYVNELAKTDGVASSSSFDDDSKQNNTDYPPPKTYNVRTSFNVEKDSIQSLIPIGKFDFVNTAVLTGNQVSVNLKIFSISYAGVISDVTLQTMCSVKELSVIKVTPSCTSVYVDGSESRGDMNALINVTFGNFNVLASYNVWYPEFPVDIIVSDPVLHAIKNWRINDEKYFVWSHRRKKRNGTIALKNESLSDAKNGPMLKGKSKAQSHCRLRFQESMIRVFARFRVDDLSTGRRAYLGGRKSQFDVTLLGRDHLKVVDPRLAYMKTADGAVFVQGLYPGRTEIQLISSYSRIPFGAAQIEITNEKVNIRSLKAESVADLNLFIFADTSAADIYHVIVQKSTVFTKRYQAGRVKLDVEYSSGFSLPLSFISSEDYLLDVTSKDNSLVLLNFDKQQYEDQVRYQKEQRFANNVYPLPNSKLHRNSGKGFSSNVPTFLVIGETTGNVLYVSLFSASICYRNSDGPLYSTTVFVEAAFEKVDTFSKDEDTSRFGTNNQTNLLPAIEPQRADQSNSFEFSHDFFSSRRSADVSVRNPPVGNFPLQKQELEIKRLTHMEVAIYIILALFICLFAGLALHCYVVTQKSANSSRRSTRMTSSRRNVVITPSALKYATLLNPPEWARWPMDILVRFIRKNAGAVASARQEFVWVGPEELNDSLASSCSQRLLNKDSNFDNHTMYSRFEDEYNDGDCQEFCKSRAAPIDCKASYDVDDDDTNWIDDDDYDDNVVAAITAVQPKVDPLPAVIVANALRMAPLFADNDDWPMSPITLQESATLTRDRLNIHLEPDGCDESLERSSTFVGSLDDKTISVRTNNTLPSKIVNVNGVTLSIDNVVPTGFYEEKLVHCNTRPHDDQRNNAISYLGSEVSIIMSRKPLLEVHDNKIKAASWNEKNVSKCKLDSINSFTEPKAVLQKCSSRRGQVADSSLVTRTWLRRHQRKRFPVRNKTSGIQYQRPSIRNYLKQYTGNSQNLNGQRSNGRMRITSNPIGDSSSEQNLSSYCTNANRRRLVNDGLNSPAITSSSSAINFFGFGFGLTAKSESDLNWDSASLGMDESQLRDYFNSLRESMA